ncbi:MAG: non-canonical purine NTP pyrophosphatase, partial [Burkholderiaceae bacterium]|nr:non-canonical purine NTP pyrophosphatase [Burkholderiaceae bacterium]
GTPRGRNGFGYDPHFLLPQLGLTAAELAPARKNAISHRGQALAALRQKLRALWGW